MNTRIAYVLAGPTDKAAIRRNAELGQSPRADFNVFCDRTNAQLFSLDDADRARGFLARLLLRINRRLALGFFLSEQNPPYQALISSGEDGGIPLALSASLSRTPPKVGIIIHGFFFDSPKFSAVAQILKRMRNVYFLCLASSLRDQMIARWGFSPERCKVIGYGTDVEFFKPRQAPGTENLIVSAGASNRDYKTLIEACDGLDVAVRIAAQSLWFDIQIDLPDTDKLPSNVHVGSCGTMVNLRELYAQAAIVVVPLYPATHASGYAVIAEAMAMGKPVIATRTEGASDLIVDGETGFYVEPGDVGELRSTIRKLLDNPALAQRIGQNARKSVEAHHTSAHVCERIEEVLSAAVG